MFAPLGVGRLTTFFEFWVRPDAEELRPEVEAMLREPLGSHKRSGSETDKDWGGRRKKCQDTSLSLVYRV